MTIEFPCSSCRQLLRVADATAGKTARCPQCGALTPIPEASAPVSGEADAGGGDQPGQVGGGSPFASPGTTEGSANPYASPTTAGRFEAAPAAPLIERHGPPWERDGMGLRSFLVTLKEVVFQPRWMFSGLRLNGGFWRPLAFTMINTFIGVFVMAAFNLAFMAIMLTMMGGGGGPGGEIWIFVGVYAGVAVASPVYALIACFLAAGIHHLALMAVGGANENFEATFRVVAYCFGPAHLVLALPICGPYLVILPVPYVVYLCIGLAYAQNISGGKAAVAGLVPVLLCCGVVGGSYFLMIFWAMSRF